jgi:hypothetical protein
VKSPKKSKRTVNRERTDVCVLTDNVARENKDTKDEQLRSLRGQIDRGYSELDENATGFAKTCGIIFDLPMTTKQDLPEKKRHNLDNMMWKVKWSRFTECFCRRPGLVLVSLPCLLIIVLYLISGNDYDEYDVSHYPSFKPYNIAEGENRPRNPREDPCNFFALPLLSVVVRNSDAS